MAKRLADSLGVGVDRVSVKAKSPEGLGLLGRREGIAALAVVGVEVP
jgi:2C-methyl-D-erythritol 2,4-cyclodiphosphate synthase